MIPLFPRTDKLVVTDGKLIASAIQTPQLRGVLSYETSPAAAVEFVIEKPTAQVLALSSGEMRYQVGLKLCAADMGGCNVLYVMWRQQMPALYVQLKNNPNMTTYLECKNNGYTAITSSRASLPPPLVSGVPHRLQAELLDGLLTVIADGVVCWRGIVDVPFTGAVGIRTDNLQLSNVVFYAPW